MTDKLALAQKLSKILGWDDMLVQVALPCLNSIINQFVFQQCDCFGVPIEDVEANLEEDMLKLSSDALWRLLVEDFCEDYNPCSLYIDFREEIEHYMKQGYTFKQAIYEWDL